MRGLFLAVLASAAAAACTSTTTSVTAPSADKCQVSASAPGSFDASGGSATVAVTAARDCSWAAATNVAWVTINGSGNGQGDGTIAFSVAPNPAPSPRNGTLNVGSQDLPLIQAAAACRYAISRNADTVGVDGGRLSFQLTTLTGCSWTATSNASWLTVSSGSSGNASATISVSV